MIIQNRKIYKGRECIFADTEKAEVHMEIRKSIIKILISEWKVDFPKAWRCLHAVHVCSAFRRPSGLESIKEKVEGAITHLTKESSLFWSGAAGSLQ